MSTLSAEQVAAHFGVTAETVRAKARADVIPGYRLGRTWRFDLDEVKAALKPSTDPWAQSPQSVNARRKR